MQDDSRGERLLCTFFFLSEVSPLAKKLFTAVPYITLVNSETTNTETERRISACISLPWVPLYHIPLWRCPMRSCIG